MAETFTFTIKPIADLGDIKANVGTIQSYFNKLKMPKFSNQIEAEAQKITKAYDVISKKQIEGIKTAADANQIEKNQNIILHSWGEILDIIKEVSKSEIEIDFSKFTEQVKEAEQAVKDLEKQVNDKLKNIDTTKLQSLINGENGLTKITKSQNLQNYAKDMNIALQRKQYAEFISIYKEAQQYVDKNPMFSQKVKDNMTEMGRQVQQVKQAIGGELLTNLQQAQEHVVNVKADTIQDVSKAFQNAAGSADKLKQEAADVAENNNKVAKSSVELSKTAQTIERQVESYFGLNAIFRTVANMAREAMNTVKELDKAMTETAVVTNFSVGDMWEKLPLYTAEANKLGSSIKDVYEATTLYYQQGLNTTQSMGLAVETLKMARIAGMDAKDATDAMTAALRGFNLELNEVSAKRINDVYSELAAITASDTQEISTAMEKVASLAHNAGMELETTSAFLAQMIETTREAPENLGTALKTVVARFQEMKQDPTKLIDSEGVMLDANKVDKALKSIGVNLLNANGEFRKLDDVFLEIASRWDTLSMGQQRYIATMAAGSRQQSRFIAMMSNYSRTMELVDAAYDSSGASQRQFEKTLESMEAKLNKLKNAYDQFIMGLMNNDFLKGIVDFGTDALTVLNKIIDTISSWTGPLKSTTKMILTLISTFGGLTAARGLLKGGIGLGVQWFSGKDARKEFEQKYFGKKEGQAEFKIIPRIDSQTYQSEKAKIIADSKKPIIQRIEPTVEIDDAAKNRIGEKIGVWADMGLTREAIDDLTEQEIAMEKIRSGIETYPEGYNKVSASIQNMGASIQNAGFALQSFGSLLQNTPLAPFGKVISITGTALVSLGGTFATVSHIMITESVGLGTALWTALAPILAITAAVAALAGIGYLLYREFTKDKREMEALAEAAKASSDAFDNLKTATETLKNSIEDIRNSDSLFDGLIVGTTEWNLALVEANQQVLDLIKKYPMLQKYMSTDTNGRMSISEAGFKAVQEEQNKLLGQAQALDIYNNALHNAALQRQEQDKLLKEEKINKTKTRTVRRGRNSYTITEEQADEINYNQLSDEGKAQWNSVEAKIEAESAAARKQAVRAALSANGELNDTVLNLFGQNLDEAVKSFEGETDMSTIKQAYADFIGGVFNSATGKITDIGGEEVDVDNDALKKMYPQIMALLRFQDQAPQVESAVKSLGKSFDSVFGDRQGNNFINDLLNNNLEIDFSALEKFRNMSETEIEDVLENISDEEVKAIMQSDTAQKSDLINLLKGNANNLVQAQTKSYKDVAVWYAKSVKKYNAEAASHSGKTLSKAVLEGLTASSADAINHFMDNISQSFDAVTVSTMGENLFSAILGQPSEIQASITKLINGVDWSSAIERGNFYAQYEEGSKAFKELNDQQKKFVTGQKKVDKSLDLTGKQFEELVQSSDFLEILTEKWSDFADESGKVDATGIREMAKECGTLSKVLNLAEFDADNLAMALNYFQKTGSFEGITGAVIAAAKEFNSLDKLIDDVKQDVENFKPGENYDQGMDAYRGYMKSLKEGYESRQYSDADTLSYAHRFVNSSEWKEFAKAHGGSNKSAEKEIIDSLETIFTENEEDTTINILDRLASGKTLLGGEAKESDVFSAYYNDEGQLKLDIDPTTTREAFIKALVDERGFTEEMARAFTLSLEGQDWGFIDDNLTDAFNKAGRDSGIAEYIKGIQGRGLIPENGTPQGNVVISESEIAALQEMGGYDSLDAVIADIESSLNVLPGTIQRFNAETETAADYLQKLYGANANAQDSAKDFLEVSQNGIGNFNAATEKLQQSGIDAVTALNMAIDMAHQAGVTQVKWGEDLIPVSDIINGEQFNEAVKALEEEGHWQDVGEILGRAVANALAEAGIGNGVQDNNTDNTSENNKSSNFTVPDIKAEITSQFSADKIQSQINEATRGITANFEAGLEVDKTNAFEGISEVKQEAEKKVITPVDADTKDAITKDGILVSEIEKEVTKQVTADTAPAQTAVDELDQRASQPVFKTINATITGLTQKLKSFFGLAKGQNNYISPSGFYTGSAAKGIKGTLGPNGKGGLTLTGEEGFEIAWLPSEGRAMILGAAGPQMTNLPSDAVVYTHEQSKKIVKQKGISTGSAYGGTYDSPSGAINVNIVGDKTSGSGSGSGSSSSSKEKDPKHTNWYKEEITRYNLNQSINKIAENIKKTTEEIDKILDKVGTKYSDIANNVAQEAKLIKQNIENQKALRDSFQSQLNLLDKGGRSLWIDIMDSAGESSQKSISTSQFVYKDKDGAYKVDKNKVLSYAASLGGDANTQQINAEAIFSAISSEVGNLTSGLISAEQAILDYEKQLEERIEKISEAFFAWENELTKIYDLTQKISNSDSQSSRLTAETSMLLARVEAGFISVGKAGEYLQRVQKNSAKLIAERIALTREDINERKKDLKSFVSSADEWSEYQKIREQNKKLASEGKFTGKTAEKQQAKEDAAYAKYQSSALMNSYVKQTRNADGTYEFDFNEAQLEKDRNAGKINEATYNAIKEGFDEMVQKNEELNEAIANAADDMAEVYETYNNHLQTMADLEAKLTDAFEQAAQREVSKLEALNTSLTNATKAILDQVKKNIQARRQAEDNAKTEGDITKKQQRLAALRANTGGGNQVEIAQLEKEIGDAQSSYGRTLEDQLMANMQSQADEASKQRQEQIDLAKQQIDYNREAGIYAAEADRLLENVQGNQQTIQNVLQSTQTETLGKWGTLVEKNDIKRQVTEAMVAEDAIPALKAVITSSGNALAASISAWNGNMMKTDKKNTTKENKSTKGIDSVKDKKDKIKNKPKNTGSGSGSSGKTVTPGKGDWDYSSGWLITLPETSSNNFAPYQISNLQHGLNTMKWSKLISFGADLKTNGIMDDKTVTAIKALQKLVGVSQDGVWGPKTAKEVHKQYSKYARGGLASKTGPAWLDGTPTKPELVLNAQDTKNFIALKDILSGVMRSISHTDTSNIYNSPTNFEINVNVEKIASDYDVDKLTERIKRNIVKDATYRNVTSVRKFK